MTQRIRPCQAVVRGYGLLTGWGPELASLPTNAMVAAQGQRIIPLATPACDSERLRRATRECLIAVAVVEQALRASGLPPEAVAGPQTALIFASASAYAAANWAFLTSGTEGALHFPYTAPGAVPGEVTIQFGITGPYIVLLSGANAGVEALWQAATLLTTGQCERVLVLGVETFAECAELYTAGRWLLGAPLVEAAACLVVERHPDLERVHYRAEQSQEGFHVLKAMQPGQGATAVSLCLPTARDGGSMARGVRERWPAMAVTAVHERLGGGLACAPLISVMLAMAEGQQGDLVLLSRWWDTWSALRWPLGSIAAS